MSQTKSARMIETLVPNDVPADVDTVTALLEAGFSRAEVEASLAAEFRMSAHRALQSAVPSPEVREIEIEFETDSMENMGEDGPLFSDHGPDSVHRSLSDSVVTTSCEDSFNRSLNSAQYATDSEDATIDKIGHGDDTNQIENGDVLESKKPGAVAVATSGLLPFHTKKEILTAMAIVDSALMMKRQEDEEEQVRVRTRNYAHPLSPINVATRTVKGVRDRLTQSTTDMAAGFESIRQRMITGNSPRNDQGRDSVTPGSDSKSGLAPDGRSGRNPRRPSIPDQLKNPFSFSPQGRRRSRTLRSESENRRHSSANDALRALEPITSRPNRNSYGGERSSRPSRSLQGEGQASGSLDSRSTPLTQSTASPQLWRGSMPTPSTPQSYDRPTDAHNPPSGRRNQTRRQTWSRRDGVGTTRSHPGQDYSGFESTPFPNDSNRGGTRISTPRNNSTTVRPSGDSWAMRSPSTSSSSPSIVENTTVRTPLQRRISSPSESSFDITGHPTRSGGRRSRGPQSPVEALRQTARILGDRIGSARSHEHHTSRPSRASHTSASRDLTRSDRHTGQPSATGRPLMYEISPQVQLPLRGANETYAAIQNGDYGPAACSSCGKDILVVLDAEYVVCPFCKQISPCDGHNANSRHGVGLGFHADYVLKIQDAIARGIDPSMVPMG